FFEMVTSISSSPVITLSVLITLTEFNGEASTVVKTKFSDGSTIGVTALTAVVVETEGLIILSYFFSNACRSFVLVRSYSSVLPFFKCIIALLSFISKFSAIVSLTTLTSVTGLTTFATLASLTTVEAIATSLIPHLSSKAFFWSFSES